MTSVTQKTHYHIFQLSKKGKLKVPMYREQYEYTDDRAFLKGYDTVIDAEQDIERFLTQQAKRLGDTSMSMGDTSISEDYVILPITTYTVTLPKQK